MSKPDFSAQSWIIFLLTVVLLAGCSLLAWHLARDYFTGPHEKVEGLDEEVATLRARLGEVEPRVDDAEQRMDAAARDAVTRMEQELSAYVDELKKGLGAGGGTTGDLDAVVAALRTAVDDLESEQADTARRLVKVERDTVSIRTGLRDLPRSEDVEALKRKVDGLPAGGGDAADLVDALRRRLEPRIAKLESAPRTLPDRDVLDALPVGTILPWDSRRRSRDGNLIGGHQDVPDGWRECNGRGGTPNLVGAFPQGTATERDVGDRDGMRKIPKNDDHYHYSDPRMSVRADREESSVYVRLVPRGSGEGIARFSPHGEHDHGKDGTPEYEPLHVKVRFIIKVSSD